MSTTVQQIKERLNVVDVVGAYVKLERAGKNFKAKCPFHNEKTPSFFVTPDRGTYYCFGCGAKGDIFSFVEEFEKLDFAGALKILAERAGVVIVRENKEVRDQRERLYEVLELAAEFFAKNLKENQAALDYLKGRGVTYETIRSWRLGFALPGWRTLYERLRLDGRKDEELLAAGLVKRGEDRGNLYDRFRSRIMFPIFDSSGRVIAFSGRIFGEEGKDAEAKYLNSPETELFHKSSVLYGFNLAKYGIRTNDFAVVVEGQMDVILSSQAGYRNTVAASGTALTEEHLKNLKRLTNRLVFAFDADKAGFSAARRSARLALSLGMEIKMAALPRGRDPADLAGTDVSAWKKAVANSVHIVDFVLAEIKASGLKGRKLAEEVQKNVLPFVAALDNKIEQGQFARKIAAEIDVSENSIYEELKKVPQEISLEKVSGVTLRPDRRDFVARQLAGIIFSNQAKGGNAELVAKIKQVLVRVLGKDAALKFLDNFENDRGKLLLEVELEYDRKEVMESAAAEFLVDFERDELREQFVSGMKALALAEKAKDSKEAMKYLKICQDLSRHLQELSVRK